VRPLMMLVAGVAGARDRRGATQMPDNASVAPIREQKERAKRKGNSTRAGQTQGRYPYLCYACNYV
jgi:hypothetical protein